MHVRLKSHASLEEACISFEQTVLGDVLYYSDDTFDAVTYTFTASLEKAVQDWSCRAKATGFVDEVEIVEE